MLDEFDERIDAILRAVRADEATFNRLADAARLGVHLRHGRLYPDVIGQTHTGRIARALLSPATIHSCAAPGWR